MKTYFAIISMAAIDWMVLAFVAAAQTTPTELPMEGLGTHRRHISSTSAEAQLKFNQGLAFLYGFNHAEAIRLFEQAAEHDPEHPMPYWGIAVANGPNINYPIVDEARAQAAWAAVTKAQAVASLGTPVEQALVAAVAKRYANPQPLDRKPLDEAYAAAMGNVWQKYPADADVGALYAEALMDLRPWDQWTQDGVPQAGTAEVLATLESVLARSPNHPLALHLYIHAVEASPHPEFAESAADRLRDLQPGLGHMVHMPSHIDVRLGRWDRAIEANERAIRSDAAYRARQPDQDFYRTYMAHNHHMLIFAAMMSGRQQRSTVAATAMLTEIPTEWLAQNAPFVDAFFATPYELHLRFGRWQEMLAEPEPRPDLPVSRAVRWYARGVAQAALKNVRAAREEQARFRAEKVKVSAEAVFVLNPAQSVLGIADQVLEGEILYREGETEAALAALREAVRLEDQLRYIEPPDWIQPVRHVLGATLLDAGQHAEAEAVFRRDLQKYPHNGWSLYGLSRALRGQQKLAEAGAVDTELQQAWKQADTPLTSSCLCLPQQ